MSVLMGKCYCWVSAGAWCSFFLSLVAEGEGDGQCQTPDNSSDGPLWNSGCFTAINSFRQASLLLDGCFVSLGGWGAKHRENWCLSQTCTIAGLELVPVQFQFSQLRALTAGLPTYRSCGRRCREQTGCCGLDVMEML